MGNHCQDLSRQPQISSQEVSSTHHHTGAGIRPAFLNFKSKVAKKFKNRAKRKDATEDDKEATVDNKGDRRCQWDIVQAIPKDTPKQCFKYAVKARTEWPVIITDYTRGSYHFVVMLRAYNPDSMIDIVKMERKDEST